jgi:hypothetical protein
MGEKKKVELLIFTHEGERKQQRLEQQATE